MNHIIALPNTEWDKTELQNLKHDFDMVISSPSLSGLDHKQQNSESKMPLEELKGDDKPENKTFESKVVSLTQASDKISKAQSNTQVATLTISQQKPVEQKAIDPLDSQEATLPLIGARLDIMSRIDIVKPLDYNERLVSLETVLGLLANHPRKYNFLLTELKSQKVSSTIQSFKEKIYETVIAVFKHHEISIGKLGDIDLNMFISTASGLRDLNLFNLEQREKIIERYRAYCVKSSKEVDDQFVHKFLEKRIDDSIEGKPLNTVGVKKSSRAIVSQATIVQSGNKSTQLLPPPSLLHVTGMLKEESKKSDSIFEGMKVKGKTYQTMDLLTLTDREACVICMANIRGVLFMPCRHFVTCKGCSSIFQECPICTTKLTNKINVFWS